MRKQVVPVVLALVTLSGCGAAGTGPMGPSSPAPGQFKVLMTDAPAAVQAVHVMVDSVLAHHAGAVDASGWVTLSSTQQDVDLLSYRNGVFLPLADATVPAGAYDGIRLVLGPGCTVTVDGVTQPLTVPSGAQSGLKINGSFPVASGGELALQMDFDASQSLHQNGSGAWMLQPVLRVLPVPEAGAIEGTVTPASAVSGIDVFEGGVLVTSVVPNADGTFAASVLPAGIYVVVVHATSGDRSIAGVVVNPGVATDLGTLSMGSRAGGPGGPRHSG